MLTLPLSPHLLIIKTATTTLFQWPGGFQLSSEASKTLQVSVPPRSDSRFLQARLINFSLIHWHRKKSSSRPTKKWAGDWNALHLRVLGQDLCTRYRWSVSPVKVSDISSTWCIHDEFPVLWWDGVWSMIPHNRPEHVWILHHHHYHIVYYGSSEWQSKML